MQCPLVEVGGRQCPWPSSGGLCEVFLEALPIVFSPLNDSVSHQYFMRTLFLLLEWILLSIDEAKPIK